MLERAVVARDQLAHRGVIVAQHVQELFRLGRLREGGEAAQIAEENRYVCAVSAQELLSVVRGDELGHLRRDEARELAALAFDRFEQPRIRDRDCRLFGEEPD
jgi:hypothetical protein